MQSGGYPFRYRNFSIDQIDSYQDGSGRNAKAFIDEVLDPTVIAFGTIDDIDQVAGKRGDRQTSAGQLEVTAMFMGVTAGANTLVRGACTFGMFSNYPENVDDTLRRQAGARFLVDGPQSRRDDIDILALLLEKTTRSRSGRMNFLPSRKKGGCNSFLILSPSTRGKSDKGLGSGDQGAGQPRYSGRAGYLSVGNSRCRCPLHRPGGKEYHGCGKSAGDGF